MKVKEYQIVQSLSVDGLVSQVNTRIAQGFQPYGNLIFTDYHYGYIQVIVKYQEG